MAFHKHTMKLTVNFLRTNTEIFPSVGVQHCSNKERRKDALLEKA